MEKLYSKTAVISLFFLLTVSLGSGTYLINSQEWQDVYSGSYYSYSQNQTPYFLRSDNLGVVNVMPYGDDVNIIESSDSPVVSNAAAQLRSQGYSIGSVTTVENANLELVQDPENVIVVPSDYPAAAITAAPYARATDSWVLIASGENVDQVEQVMQQASRAVMIGDFGRTLSSNLGDESNMNITSPNKFNLSIKVTKAFLEEKDTETVLMASGNYISRGIMEGENPVLLSGTNYLPESTRRYLLENPGHNFSTAVMVGNEMTTVGQELRDYNITRNGETTDEKMNVFVKYGQARGNSQSIYAISLFPVPTGQLSLSIPEINYDPQSDELMITYSNNGPSRMYELTSFEILVDGNVVETGGDQDAVFIGGDTNRTVSYDLNLTASQARQASIQFSTTYGTSPSQLDTYLTEQGRFSPPLTKNITVNQIQDSSNVTVESVTYLKNADRFKVVLRNPGRTPAYGQARLLNVMVNGETTSFETERKRIPAGDKESFYIPVELDSIDIQQNQNVQVSVSYGENRGALVKTETATRKTEVTAKLVNSDTTVFAGAGIIVLMLVLVLAYRRSDIKLEVSTE